MDFVEELTELSNRVSKLRNDLQTEEATKTALVMPFIKILGYDVFNPKEVVPEFTTDVGIKKGEKVDYAILKNNKPIILFECKSCNCPMDDTHANQLYRYFSTTTARIGILTNGILYKLFTDLDKPNIMDNKPFMVLDLENIEENLIQELKKLTKHKFNIDETLSSASELKYTREIKKLLLADLENPSSDFVRYLASKVYTGKLTKNVREQFNNIVKKAFNSFINDSINERLKNAMATEEQGPNIENIINTDKDKSYEIETTEEELEGYYIVKSLLRQICDPNRITHRDRKYYFNIIFDDNIRKPICRLYLNTSKKYIGIYDDNKNEERIHIEELNDIFKFSSRLKSTLKQYL